MRGCENPRGVGKHTAMASAAVLRTILSQDYGGSDSDEELAGWEEVSGGPPHPLRTLLAAVRQNVLHLRGTAWTFIACGYVPPAGE